MTYTLNCVLINIFFILYKWNKKNKEYIDHLFSRRCNHLLRRYVFCAIFSDQTG